MEEFWGCHPISTFRESLEDSSGLKKKRKLFSNLDCYHHSLLKVGLLALYFVFSMVDHACSCILSVVLLFVACLYVGLIWRVLFCVVLGCFLVYYDVLYSGVFMGCIWHYSPLDREEVAMWG